MASRTPARMTTAPPPPAAGTCDASMADGTNLFGPCILRHHHDGPVHKDSTGTRWALPDRSGDPVLASRSRELAELREQLARFHEGEEPVTSVLHVATPGQWIWTWNRATPDHRLQVVRDIQSHAALADRCFQGGHEARLDQQQARITRLEADVASSDEAARRAMEQRQDMATERYALQERADAAERRRDELAATLHDVLRHFTQKGHPGEPCLQTGWIAEKTVARWRAVLNPPATEEQPPEDTAQCWRKEPHVPHTWTLSPEEGGVDCPGVDRPATEEQQPVEPCPLNYCDPDHCGRSDTSPCKWVATTVKEPT